MNQEIVTTELLQYIIKTCGLDYTILATECGKSKQTISNWVCGRTTPGLSDRKIICTITNGKLPEYYWEYVHKRKIKNNT